MQPKDKAYYLDLIRRQSQEMRELGFLGSPGAEALTQTEAKLARLDLSLLKSIARGAENLLKAAAKLPRD
jgi:hypothetical protein